MGKDKIVLFSIFEKGKKYNYFRILKTFKNYHFGNYKYFLSFLYKVLKTKFFICNFEQKNFNQEKTKKLFFNFFI